MPGAECWAGAGDPQPCVFPRKGLGHGLCCDLGESWCPRGCRFLKQGSFPWAGWKAEGVSSTLMKDLRDTRGRVR